MKISRVIRWAGFVLLLLAIPASSFAGVFVQVTIAPPVLPVYVQPACPGDGYIWTPGYWAYGPDGYYWVPHVGAGAGPGFFGRQDIGAGVEVFMFGTPDTGARTSGSMAA
jgi:hypothetical protein